MKLRIVLKWTVTSAPITHLYRIREINARLRDLLPIIEKYLADKLSQVFPFTVYTDGAKCFEINGVVFKLPGYTGVGQDLQDLLGTVEANVNTGLKDRVKALVAPKPIY